jgi:hypothetical protein
MHFLMSFWFFSLLFFLLFLILFTAVHPIRVLLEADALLSECDEPRTLKARSVQVLWV